MKSNLSYFKNKNILITGASSGIGFELTMILSSVARALIILDVNEAGLEKIKSNLTDKKCKLYSFKVDLSDTKNVLKICENIELEDIPEIIFANAGLGGVNPGNAFSVDIDRKIFDVNYFGTINTFAPFLDSMIQRKNGHLVGISSLASLRGLPSAASYSASKAAQANLLESWRNDLSPFGIKVTTIFPGFIKTPMVEHDEFDMPFMVDVEDCAYAILNAVSKNKKVYMFPFPMKILSLINKFLPACLFDFILPRVSGGGVKNEAKIF